jgi:hypothetical protein
MSRNLKFGIAMVLIILAVIELQALAFTHLALRLGALRFYSGGIFSGLSDDELARATPRGPLGWPADDAARTAPSDQLPICGSAFGDSLTYGAEVADDEAWVHLLSLRLGCRVANHGVSAYGLDQAVLRHERIATDGNFVILGVYLEMIRRSVAASWTFYAPLHPMAFYQIKPYFTVAGNGLRLHPIPEPLTREAIAAHHAGDHFMQRVATPVQFPYTFAAAKALSLRLFSVDDYRRHTDIYVRTDHRSGSGVIARRLIDRMAATAGTRNSRVAVVLMPHAERLTTESAPHDEFAEELRRRGGLCVIDTKPVLRDHARTLGGKLPTEPRGHHAPLGNRLIADAVAAGLRACGIGR